MSATVQEVRARRVNLAIIIMALLLPLPALLLRITGAHNAPLLDALIYGVAVVGAAFQLSWGAEVAQHYIPRAFAFMFLALIAVLPEYAVDMYLSWQAAGDPSYAPLALVNMTGANRLLIGIGWPVVVALYCWRARAAGRRGLEATGVSIERSQSIEVAYLGLATIYSFIIPLKGTLGLVDLVILVTIFGFYAMHVARQPTEEPEAIGPAKLIGAMTNRLRLGMTIFLFIYAGVSIFMVAEPFAEALIHAGEDLGFDRRTLIQWLAPLASETPEFIVVSIFAWRLMGAASLGALVSSKVNQWTLLVSTIPLVYNISSAVKGLGFPRPLVLDQIQREDLFLTSAQSFFAVAILIGLRLSIWEAAMLTTLFMIQFVFPDTQWWVTVIYLVFGAFYLWRNRDQLPDIWRGLRGQSAQNAEAPPSEPPTAAHRGAEH